jgi:hypothetical protein
MVLSTDKWLVWLGIRQPQGDTSVVAGLISKLRTNVGDWSAFQTLVGGTSDYSSLQADLEGAGLTTEDASRLVEEIQNSYDSFTAFSDSVASLGSYLEFQAQFGSTEGISGGGPGDDGEDVAGIRIFEEAGTSFDGVSLPQGAVEVYGTRIEFSQKSATGDLPDDPDPIQYGTLQFTPSSPEDVGFLVDAEVQITNPNSGQAVSGSVPVLRDGIVVTDKQYDLAGGASTTISYVFTAFSPKQTEVQIGQAGPKTFTFQSPYS